MICFILHNIRSKTWRSSLRKPRKPSSLFISWSENLVMSLFGRFWNLLLKMEIRESLTSLSTLCAFYIVGFFHFVEMQWKYYLYFQIGLEKFETMTKYSVETFYTPVLEVCNVCSCVSRDYSLIHTIY